MRCRRRKLYVLLQSFEGLPNEEGKESNVRSPEIIDSVCFF